MNEQPVPVEQLASYAAAVATCADRYAKAFYPLTKDADEKLVCCVHGAEDMDAYMTAAAVLRGLGVDVSGIVERPISQRGLYGAEILDTAASWTERAAFSALFEGALLARLDVLAKSSYAPLAEMATSAIAREERHVAHGLDLLRRASSSADDKPVAQAAVDRIWPIALAALGGDDLRPAFVDATRAKLGVLGLSVPG